jgi:hypothetical protein
MKTRVEGIRALKWRASYPMSIKKVCHLLRKLKPPGRALIGPG